MAILSSLKRILHMVPVLRKAELGGVRVSRLGDRVKKRTLRLDGVVDPRS